MKLTRNIGRLDFVFRIGISLVMLYFGLFDTTLFQDQLATTALTIIGCLSLIIAIIGFCPLYAAIGISTCHENSDQ